MNKTEYIMFDLDGTLTDPYEGITNSLAYAIGKAGFAVPPKSVLKKYIGPPLIPSFIDDFGVDEAFSRKMLDYYREYYEPHGIFENEVYPGIGEMLACLKKKGATLIVATSKPEPYAAEIIKHFGLAEYFSAVCGNTMDESRTTKSDIIAYVKECFTGIDGGNALMVGDRRYDIEGAEANGIPAIGVLYGYGSEAEFDGAAFIAQSVAELKEFLLGRL